MALLVLRKERKILEDSEITKDYKILKKFLKETPNLKKRELNNLPKDAVNFFRNIFPKVLKEAQNEWVVDKNSVEYVMGNHMKCELCGQRPIKKVCIIENKLNKGKMRIGTECVTNFGLKNDISIEKLIEASKKTKLSEQINKVYPGIDRLIREWDKFVGEQEILIKKDIVQDYLIYGEKSKKIFEEYIDVKTLNKRREKILKELGNLLEKRDKEMEKIQDYVFINRNNPLIPDRQLLNRIKRSNNWEVLEMLREDGIIRHRTLFRINDEEFSKSLVGKINKEMKKISCKVSNVTSNKGVGYIYSYQNKNRINLFCKHEKFFFEFYNFITGDPGDDLSFEELLKISDVHGSESVESFLYELFSFVKNLGFQIDNSIYHEYNDFYVFNREKKQYHEMNLEDTINIFKSDIFFKSTSISDKILKYIEKPSNRTMSIEDYNYIRKFDLI